jgi:hypothetical protein
MSEAFVSNFMRAAVYITGMERALAVNADLEIVDSVNLQQADIESERFTGVEAIQKAVESGRYIISNNLKIDPAQAPTTNVNFSDLRVVIALPLMGHGAVYLDQPLRNGMVPRETVEKLMALAQHVIQQQGEEASASDLVALYEQM